MTSYSYLNYVHALVGTFPRLQLLADFTSPDIRIRNFHSDKDVQRRMSKVDTVVADLGASSAETRQFDDIHALKDHLQRKAPSGYIRVVVTEDLSRDVIELLGSQFSLDPRFFENHLRGIQSFLANCRSGDTTPRIESAKSEVLSREFYSVNFARPYEFHGWSAAYSSRVELNIPPTGGVVRNLHLQERASVYGPNREWWRSTMCVYSHCICYKHFYMLRLWSSD